MPLDFKTTTKINASSVFKSNLISKTKSVISSFLSLASLILLLSNSGNAQQLAFPGAEGYGAYATGGRGGEVYHVTHLKDSGQGSFRDAVSKPNRTVVFDLSGVIKIGSRINVASNVTIAGQTAPGEGISIYGNGISFSKQKNIIVRYIRFRGSINMSRGSCTVTADSVQNVIFDHVSIEWGRWDNLHIQGSKDVTLQYCLIGEAIDPQRFGALLERPERLTIHHCLWIDNQSRNPKAKAGIEYINNVVYNWGSSGFVGGHSSAHHYQDLINNYFIAGPNSSGSYLSMFTATDHVYHQGNMVDLDKDGILNGKPVIDSAFKGASIVTKRQNESPVKVTIQSAADAYTKVLDEAGASQKRDAIDRRLASYLRSLGQAGKVFWTETEAGGHPKIEELKALADTDADGMPDTWEKTHSLNPTNAEDRNLLVKKSHYTRLEQYLNTIVDSSVQASN